MKAKSIKGNSANEIQLSLLQSMADGFKPTLAIVFLSVKQDRETVCKILDDAGISIYGAGTLNRDFTTTCDVLDLPRSTHPGSCAV